MINILLTWNEFWVNIGEFFKRIGNDLYTFWINPSEGTPYLATFLFALVYLVLGYFLIKLINKIIRKLFKINKRRFTNDKTIKNFIAKCISVLLYLFLVFSFLAMLGVSLNGVAQIFSSAILAIGLSLQDVISNFASGLIILTSKPFITGDYVNFNNGEAEGSVVDVRFLSTILETPDKQVITVPNKTITSSVIMNYSTAKNRRVNIIVGVNYDSDIDLVKETLLSLSNDDPRTIKEITPVCYLAKLNEYSLDFSLRFYVKNEDYWDVVFKINELVIKKFREKNIDIPFKRIDIYDLNDKKIDLDKETN